MHTVINPRYLRVLCSLGFLGFACLILQGCGKTHTEPRAVRGYIVTSVRTTADNGGPQDDSTHGGIISVPQIFLPNIDVSLTDSGGTLLGTIPTDLSGRFSFSRVPPGTYTLCWKADGYVDGCKGDSVSVTNKIVHLGPIPISIEGKPKTGSLYGHVSLLDGSPARTYDPIANINAFPKVTALVDDVPVGIAYVNNYGEFVMPQVPLGKYAIVRTEIDGSKFDRSLGVNVLLTSSLTYRFDIRLPNSKPAVQTLIARNAAGQRVRSPQPGDTVTVQAIPSASQKHPLRFRWRTAPGSGTLSGDSDPVVKWTVPNAPGDDVLELIAFDDRGGYSHEKLTVYTAIDGEGIVFSGQVVGSDGPNLDRVTVSVAGKTVTTDTAGHFTVRVGEQDRYILHMTHPDYAFLSQIYDNGVRGGRWTLYRAHIEPNQDPDNDIEVTDQSSPEYCRGSITSRMDWRATPLRDRVQFQNGSGKIIDRSIPREDRAAIDAVRARRKCGPGITVKIPGGSLRDAGGNPPTGPVDVKLSTIDITAPNAMPGNWTSIENSGEMRVMQSYGAGTISITDASGTEFSKLADGMTAQVDIPVDQMQLAFPGPIPPVIPYLTYDEQRGLWVTNGFANLDSSGQFYTANTSHFSAANTDITKVDQSCIKLDATALPGTFEKVEVIVPDPSGAAPRIVTRDIDNTGTGDSKIHAVYNLPSNEDIYVIPINVDATGAAQPFGQFSVNTGDPQVPTDPNEPKFSCDPGDGCIGPDPYGACRVSITLSDLGAPPDPADVFLAGLQYNPSAASFLATLQPDLFAAGPDGTDFGDAVANASQDYYETVDPHSTRRNLDDFKTHHGYPGSGEIHAIYGNSGDLGFGRDMHCWENACGGPSDCDVMCYVTNYLDGGSFDSDDEEDFKRTVDAENNFTTDTNAVATVAMEYARLDDPTSAGSLIGTDRVVKFFVYAGDGTADGVDDVILGFADGALLLSADLDGKGTRPVPQLCMVCHAGSLTNNSLDITSPAFDPTDPTSADLDAIFLPFDLEAFTFVDGYLGATTWNKATQQQAFKDLNDLIVTTHPATATALAAMHTEFYASWVDADPTTHEQASGFVVPAWAGDLTNEQLYREFMGPSCRACHTAQHNSTLTFESSANFLGQTLIDTVVCSGKVMPHASATYHRFWLSLDPHQPALLDNFGNSFMAPWSDCSTAPPVEITDLTYDSVVEDLLVDNGCLGGGCHGGGAAGGFDITYANLSNNSNQAAGVPYVDANGVDNGDPLNSYMYLKITGDQGDVGGSGSQMPLVGCCLTADEQALIETWINEGAKEN